MSTPEQIGRHRILELLGTGGFASVWRGYDAELDADVAVKVLAENWAGRADIRSRFVDEARLLRRADSDRVVRVHDIGTLPDGRPYFVMSYADAGTLADRLEGEALPVADGLRLAEESARAVAVLHDLGVLHRDVKPSNILFRQTPTGEHVMIADLGLAKAVANASGITLTAGTPGYMAPEQADSGGGLDRRVDVYALGALTYRILTGRLPDSPDSPTRRLAPPERLRHGLPPGTDATVLRALSRDREIRWRDAGAYADALRELRTVLDRAPVADAGPSPAVHIGYQPTVTAPQGPARPEPHPQMPYPAQPAPFPPQGPSVRRASTGVRRRALRRRLVTLGAIVGSLVLLAGGCFAGVEYWGARITTMRAGKGQISIRVPDYWTPMIVQPATRTTSLARFGGTGTGIQLSSTVSDPDTMPSHEGVIIVAGRHLSHAPAAKVLDHSPPIDGWLPRTCQTRGVDHPTHNPAIPHGTLRTWTSGSCASSQWYGEAVLWDSGYAVLVYLKGEVDGPGGSAVFENAVTSLRVDASSLPH
jgi:hypothetical protein